MVHLSLSVPHFVPLWLDVLFLRHQLFPNVYTPEGNPSFHYRLISV